MSDESTQAEGSQLNQHEDIDTTPTQGDDTVPATPAKWTMPEPVFRQSSGKLPSGFTKNNGSEETDGDRLENGRSVPDTQENEPERSADQALPASAAAAAPAGVPAIEPQPDLSEELDLTDVIPPVRIEGAGGSGGLRKVLLLLLVLLILGLLAAVFAGIVWYLLWPGSESTFR
jgi:hypothetical protein